MAVFPVGCGDDDGGGGGGGGGGGPGGTGGTGGDGGVDGSDAEPPELAGITARHNDIRANVSPAPSSPLPPLSWSKPLSAAATEHAAKCVWEHSANGYGENIYASAGAVPTATAPVDNWASEVVNYNYESNSCSGVCGHYTQVVWATSTKLGCALEVCESGSPFNGFPTWYFVVCNYDPPGNFIGERPY